MELGVQISSEMLPDGESQANWNDRLPKSCMSPKPRTAIKIEVKKEGPNKGQRCVSLLPWSEASTMRAVFPSTRNPDSEVNLSP